MPVMMMVMVVVMMSLLMGIALFLRMIPLIRLAFLKGLTLLSGIARLRFLSLFFLFCHNTSIFLFF